jgi:hypothetical protein
MDGNTRLFAPTSSLHRLMASFVGLLSIFRGLGTMQRRQERLYKAYLPMRFSFQPGFMFLLTVRSNNVKIKTPLNKRQYNAASDEEKAQHRDVVSIRQAAEWAVGDVKGSCVRLTILQLAILLANLRTTQLGLSQVRSVYDVHKHVNVIDLFEF